MPLIKTPTAFELIFTSAAISANGLFPGLVETRNVRERDKEFVERGPIPRRELIARLKRTVEEASKTIKALPSKALVNDFVIQGYHVSGLSAIIRVSEHFSYHTGQIIYLTKLKRGKDLRFTRLPTMKSAPRRPAPQRR